MTRPTSTCSFNVPVVVVVDVDVDGFRSEQPIGTEFAMLSVPKNVEFCSSFFQFDMLKTDYGHEHVHAYDYLAQDCSVEKD
ncbi:MAG TPA: hypothetical protein VGQ81_02890 [Acidobacteriota bacterium]|nr:hypothetical protein [Acidobacteriota bacterium]